MYRLHTGSSFLIVTKSLLPSFRWGVVTTTLTLVTLSDPLVVCSTHLSMRVCLILVVLSDEGWRV